MDYLKIILISLLASCPELNCVADLLRMYGNMSAAARREVVLAAKKPGAMAWIQGLKNSYEGLDPWQRRAVLHSSAILPSAERNFWFRRLKRQATPLEIAIMDSI
jgi:hypothetical protein